MEIVWLKNQVELNFPWSLQNQFNDTKVDVTLLSSAMEALLVVRNLKNWVSCLRNLETLANVLLKTMIPTIKAYVKPMVKFYNTFKLLRFYDLLEYLGAFFCKF